MRNRLPALTTALFLCSLALLSPEPAAAQTQTVQLTSAGDRVVVNGVYVGHYTLASPGSATLDVFCIDFLNSVAVGDTWNAHFSSLSGSLDFTRQGAGATELYQRAAWLVTQFSSQAKSEWGAIHAAIWYTMAPNPEAIAKLQSSQWYRWQTGSTTVRGWLDQANVQYASINSGGFTVITDAIGVNSITGGRQEFITVTPEPAALFLLATGLAGIAMIVRRRRREDEPGGAEGI